MQKGIIGIIIAIIILGGGFYLFSQSNTPDRVSDALQEIRDDVTERDDDDSMEEHMDDDDVMKEDGDGMEKQGKLPSEGTFPLDSSASTLTYSAMRIAGSPHTGTVTISDGSVAFSGGAVTSGSFTIDMTTITEDKNNSRFLGHVNSADFFDVETYPTATFEITNLEQTSDTTAQVTGSLTVLDQTNEISFPATVTEQATTVTVNAEITIDRTRWGIIYDSGSFFSEIGDRAIRDEVPITLTLVFNR